MSENREFEIVEVGEVSEETKGQKNLPYDDGGVAPNDRKATPG